ncbi:hypothetical protein GUJ93_ZPchr0007g6379 [Zizania palustris]|uniref:Uncharacterized protein n=1 Tax=Zizania palustris TaxID=103762 RepID=A0A8J5STP2_ZIZPA|nr:hypothetical protein GUJ93_ZPchr0007g6379 [Zizania palustris]
MVAAQNLVDNSDRPLSPIGLGHAGAAAPLPLSERIPVRLRARVPTVTIGFSSSSLASGTHATRHLKSSSSSSQDRFAHAVVG